MTDDEFLNDRDCTPKPQGDTPKVNAAARVICGHGPETTIGLERRRNPFLR